MMRSAEYAGAPPARLCPTFEHAELSALLACPEVLAVVGFGRAAPRCDDPRYLRVALEPAGGKAPFEVWRAGTVQAQGRDGDVRWAHDGQLLFVAMEIDEAAVGGIQAAARTAYRALLACLESLGYPAPLRLWNYIDALLAVEHDEERYRAFNIGRAEGIAGRWSQFPAATAIGSHDGGRRLQLFGFAAREPGCAIENPRQVSAYRYPPQYGRQPPSFSRATLPDSAAMPLLLSGTASVVGHASAHPGQLDAQLDEMLRNVDSLICAARRGRGELAPALGGRSVLKVYVRDVDALPRVAAALAERLPAELRRVLLHGEICRRELLVECEGCHW